MVWPDDSSRGDQDEALYKSWEVGGEGGGYAAAKRVAYERKGIVAGPAWKRR